MASRQFVKAQIADASLGGNQAFVYVIVASAGSVALFYVGQTRQRMGALGRLAEHLSDGVSATFRQRAWELVQADVVGSVYFAAIALSRDRAFQQSSPDYREAVECLIESDLREFVVANQLNALSVARVRQHAYRTSAIVRREANRSLEELRSWLKQSIRSVRSAGEPSLRVADT